MANGTKPGNARAFQERGDTGHVIEKSAVEARQGYQSWRIFYVLVASLVLVIVAYSIIAAIGPG